MISFFLVRHLNFNIKFQVLFNITFRIQFKVEIVVFFVSCNLLVRELLSKQRSLFFCLFQCVRLIAIQSAFLSKQSPLLFVCMCRSVGS